MICKYRRFIFAVVIAGWSFPLTADEELTRQETFTTFTPWFTGPLIAPSGSTVLPGHYNVEPYLYYYVYNGRYDQDWKTYSTPNFYSTRLQIQFRMGLADRVAFQVYPQAFYNETQGQNYCNVGDLPLGFDFQLVKAKVKDYWPAVRLTIRATLPIGKYQHLHADKKRTDAIGLGSWQPSFTVVFAKLFHTAERHYLETRLVFNYVFSVPVHVKGLNSYGGGSHTRGIVHPGDTFYIDGALQYNLSQRWALACDLYYTHANHNRFSGKAGISSSGSAVVNTAPSREQISLAPALEYNWSKNLGVVGGVWFTFAGRNSSRFATGVIAFNIYI